MRQKIHFYKYVLVPVCRYLSSKELKTNSVKQMRIHYAQVQHYYRKIPGFMLRGLSISRTPLQDGQLRPVPMVSVLERVDCIQIVTMYE